MTPDQRTIDHELREYRRVAARIGYLEAQRRMNAAGPSVRDYHRVEAAIRYLEAHAEAQPSLAQVARAVGWSEFHLQRVFRRWAGVSPKRFLQFLTVERAREALRSGQSVLSAAYESGLSGPGRLHDLFVAVDAVTPGEFKRLGKDLVIRYGFHPTPFGDALIALTARGICGLAFADPASRTDVVADLRNRWRGASLVRDPHATASISERIFDARAGNGEPLTLALRGTNFQLKVWEALLRIPPGALVSYGDVARAIGYPDAHRAVGTAVGHNPVAFIIPCHRVIRSTGAFGSYRWGAPRKRAIVGWEAAQAEATGTDGER